jgi:hypothetical protein
MEWKPIVESLKELLRTGMIAMIPVAIDGLAAGAIDWRLLAASGMIACLRSLDKLLHEWGKADPGIKVSGLVGF